MRNKVTTSNGNPILTKDVVPLKSEVLEICPERNCTLQTRDPERPIRFANCMVWWGDPSDTGGYMEPAFVTLIDCAQHWEASALQYQLYNWSRSDDHSSAYQKSEDDAGALHIRPVVVAGYTVDGHPIYRRQLVAIIRYDASTERGPYGGH